MTVHNILDFSLKSIWRKKQPFIVFERYFLICRLWKLPTLTQHHKHRKRKTTRLSRLLRSMDLIKIQYTIVPLYNTGECDHNFDIFVVSTISIYIRRNRFSLYAMCYVRECVCVDFILIMSSAPNQHQNTLNSVTKIVLVMINENKGMSFCALLSYWCVV